MSSELVAPARKALVLDTNILVRAVLGRRVLSLLESYSGRVDFLTPDVAFDDLRVHLPAILAGRGLPVQAINKLLEGEVLTRLPMLVAPVFHEVYVDLEQEARRRLYRRDESDWPFVALSLRLGSPVWTEDRDFFGTGVATWTTDRIAVYSEL